MHLETATIKFLTHSVHVWIDSDLKIHCFKYNGHGCDFDIFTDRWLASDWILEPLPTIRWQVTIDRDLPDQPLNTF
jgi:hypothetical protein